MQISYCWNAFSLNFAVGHGFLTVSLSLTYRVSLKSRKFICLVLNVFVIIKPKLNLEFLYIFHLQNCNLQSLVGNAFSFHLYFQIIFASELFELIRYLDVVWKMSLFIRHNLGLIMLHIATSNSNIFLTLYHWHEICSWKPHNLSVNLFVSI